MKIERWIFMLVIYWRKRDNKKMIVSYYDWITVIHEFL